jgi:RNA polymerase sigma-70 factor (ECF subfamily)
MLENPNIEPMESLGWDKNNHAEFFESLFKKWYSVLCPFVFRIVRDNEIAQDLVQDVFVKLWEKREQIEINTSVKSYLFKACMNAALNHEAARKKYKVTNDESITLSLSDAGSTDEGLHVSELQKKINEAIDTLPPACRSVFILSRFEEMSYKEIASTLEISVKTVENQMGKALKILRVQLNDYMVLLCLVVSKFEGLAELLKYFS